MKRILRICVAVVGLLIAALAAVYGVGLALPEQHVSEGAELVPAPVDAVAQRIRDVAKQPDWRHGVDAVVEDGRDGDRVRYHESSGGDAIAFVLREQVPGRQFVTVITDADLPFGGRWQIRLEPVDGNTTRVHIREEGFVRAPFFRTISRFVIGHDTTLKAYLSDLRASFARASSGSRRHGVRGSHQAARAAAAGHEQHRDQPDLAAAEAARAGPRQRSEASAHAGNENTGGLRLAALDGERSVELSRRQSRLSGHSAPAGAALSAKRGARAGAAQSAARVRRSTH